MSLDLKYSPKTQAPQEFHRIREGHKTFNAFVQGALQSLMFNPTSNGDMCRLRRRAKRFADRTHGNIDACPYEGLRRSAY